MKKVVVAGGGVLGSQIAFQAAYCGFDVTIWLRSESSITRTQPKLDELYKNYVADIEKMAEQDKEKISFWARGLADVDSFSREECLAGAEKAYNGIKKELDLQKAAEDAYIVIESMSENADEKAAFYKKLKPFLSEKTIVVTNSSTLLPSQFAKYLLCPEKFLSLHFANHIWRNNTAEVMSQPQTDSRCFDEVMAFANDIRMVALPVTKEKSGYLLNSMLVPFLLSGLDLYVNGISDPESIDKAWTLGTGAPHGPFAIFDVVGLKTAYNIVEQYQKVPGLFAPLLKKMMMPYNFKGMKEVLGRYIEEGKLGVSAGEGFFKYSK